MADMNGFPIGMIKKFLIEYRNFPGATALARAWGVSQEEIDRILQELLREGKERGILHRKQFDIETMRYLSLEEWLHGKMRKK